MSSRRPDLDSHQKEARIENVRFLLDAGCSIEAVAQRLDMKYDTLRDLIKDWGLEVPGR